MSLLPLFFFIFVGGLTACLIIPVLIRHVRVRTENDTAQFHHTHQVPISRFGGVAFIGAFGVISAGIYFLFPKAIEAGGKNFWGIVGGATGMFLLGLWDDLKPLGAKKKLLGQVLVAVFACQNGLQIENFQSPFTSHLFPLGIWGPTITVFWLVALTNLINLIDGIDGLAGGIALMLMGLLCYSSWGNLSFPCLCAAGMVGALFGFLRFNFPPARIYMGDGGAYFLGFLIAALAVANSHKGTIMAALIAPLFVLGLPIIDVSLAIFRRGIKGFPLFRPDREHIHHRLVKLGFSRRRAVLSLYGITLAFLVLGFMAFKSQGQLIPVLIGLACLIVFILVRWLRLHRDWFLVGKMWGNSSGLRKTTQYALTLSRWLEMEGDRCDSVEHLWRDFTFLAMKFGFVRVKLTLQNGQREWIAENYPSSETQAHVHKHDFHLTQPMVLEFESDATTMDEPMFTHLCDIASEAWHKASSYCRARNGMLGFSDAETQRKPSVRATEPGGRMYVPLPWGNEALDSE